MRKLASIQRIKSLRPIRDADRIEVAEIQGWDVVVQKGEFKEGELCVFCEIDSVLPPIEPFEFLRKSCYNSRMDGFRITTVRLRGQLSQGIAFPLMILEKFGRIYLGEDKITFQGKPREHTIVIEEGTDITEIIGVRKYTRPLTFKEGNKKADFPPFIPKTDETRLESDPEVLERKIGALCYITEKLDGTSVTYYLYDGEFGVCSRNCEWEKDEQNLYWRVALKYNIEERMRACGLTNHALQGEIIGPKVQKNKYNLDELKIYFFDIYDIDEREYFHLNDLSEALYGMELEMVPLLESNVNLRGNVRGWKNKCRGESRLAEIEREGIVVRSITGIRDNIDHVNRLSFKVINPEFLIKNKEEGEG